jgi:hypothetical protein
MASKYMKKCSTSLAIKEMQSNNTEISPYSYQMAIINNTNINQCREDTGKRNPYQLLEEM